MKIRKAWVLAATAAAGLCCFTAFAAKNSQKKEWEAIDAYSSMMDSFQTDRGSDEYPDYYCGSYINDEKELVVLVKENTAEVENEIRNLTRNNHVIIEKAQYSYKDLVSLYDELNSCMDNAPNDDAELSSLIHDVSAFGIFDKENRIIVTISGLNTDKISLFKEKISDSEAIRFQNMDSPNTDISADFGENV